MAQTSCSARIVGVIRCVTVEPVLLLFMFASSLTFSAFMAMTYDKSCLTLYNATFCTVLDRHNTSGTEEFSEQSDAVQHLASAWIMRTNIANSVPATLSLLLCLGSWGDRVGRRLPLVVPCVSAMAYSLTNILNAVYMQWELEYLLLGPVLSGLGGGYLAVLMAGYTYLTHLSESQHRMKRVGVAEAAVYLSSTVSVFVSGLMVDRLGYEVTFAFALVCQGLALLYTLVLLPEIKSTAEATPPRPTSTPPTTSTAPGSTAATTATPDSAAPTCATSTATPTSTAARNSVTQRSRSGMCLGEPVRDMWRFARAARDTRVKVHLALFVLVLDVLQLCTTGENDILLLYLKRSPRNWSYTTYGYFKGAENFTRGLAVLVLLPLLKKMAAPRDTTLILAGLVSKTAGLVLLGLATEMWAVFLVVAVACLQGFPSAGLRSLMSSLVLRDEQGRLFGLVASTECVVSLVSTVMFNGLYPETLSFYDGLCFLIAAFLVFVCFIIIMCQHVEIQAHDRRSFDTRVPECYSAEAVPDDTPALTHAQQQ